MLHDIHDCTVVRNMWMSIDTSLVQSDFFRSNLFDWLEVNLSNQTHFAYGAPCPLLFASACSLLWRQRNQFIFEGGQTDHQSLFYKIIWLARDYYMA